MYESEYFEGGFDGKKWGIRFGIAVLVLIAIAGLILLVWGLVATFTGKTSGGYNKFVSNVPGFSAIAYGTSNRGKTRSLIAKHLTEVDEDVANRLTLKLNDKTEELDKIFTDDVMKRVNAIFENEKLADKLPHILALQTDLDMTTDTLTEVSESALENILSLTEELLETDVDKLKTDFRALMEDSPELLEDIEVMFEESGLESHLHRREVHDSLRELMDDPLVVETLGEMVQNPDVVEEIREYLGLTSAAFTQRRRLERFLQERATNSITESEVAAAVEVAEQGEVESYHLLSKLTDPNLVDAVEEVVLSEDPTSTVVSNVKAANNEIKEIKRNPELRKMLKKKSEMPKEIKDIVIKEGGGLCKDDLKSLAEEINKMPKRFKSKFGPIIENSSVKNLVEILCSLTKLKPILQIIRGVPEIHQNIILGLATLISFIPPSQLSMIDLSRAAIFLEELETIRLSMGENTTYDQLADMMLGMLMGEKAEEIGASPQEFENMVMEQVAYILASIPAPEFLRLGIVSANILGIIENSSDISGKESMIMLYNFIDKDKMTNFVNSFMTGSIDITDLLQQEMSIIAEHVTPEFTIKVIEQAYNGNLKSYIENFIRTNTLYLGFRNEMRETNKWGLELWETLGDFPKTNAFINAFKNKMSTMKTADLMAWINKVERDGKKNKKAVRDAKKKEKADRMKGANGETMSIQEVRELERLKREKEKLEKEKKNAALGLVEPSAAVGPASVPVNTTMQTEVAPIAYDELVVADTPYDPVGPSVVEPTTITTSSGSTITLEVPTFITLEPIPGEFTEIDLCINKNIPAVTGDSNMDFLFYLMGNPIKETGILEIYSEDQRATMRQTLEGMYAEDIVDSLENWEVVHLLRSHHGFIGFNEFEEIKDDGGYNIGIAKTPVNVPDAVERLNTIASGLGVGTVTADNLAVSLEEMDKELNEMLIRRIPKAISEEDINMMIDNYEFMVDFGLYTPQEPFRNNAQRVYNRRKRRFGNVPSRYAQAINNISRAYSIL